MDWGKCPVDRRGTLASLVIPDKFFFPFTLTDFFRGGGRGALNSTREEFIPRLYQGEGILQTEKTMPLARLVIPDKFFYFYLVGGGGGGRGNVGNH